MLLGCGCGAKALRGMHEALGAVAQSDIDPQYQMLDACAGGVNVKYPQGFTYCTSPADLDVLKGQKGYFNPANPFDPRTTGWVAPVVSPSPVVPIKSVPVPPVSPSVPIAPFVPVNYLPYLLVGGGVLALILVAGK